MAMQEPDRCESGFWHPNAPWLKRTHAAWHAKWERGVKAPADLPEIPPLAANLSGLPVLPFRLARIWAHSPARHHRFAYSMARLAQRENGYDFVAWPESRRYADEKWKASSPSFYVAVSAWGLAIGFVITEITTFYAQWDGAPKGPIILTEGPPKVIVGLVWVAHAYRRQGVGRTLVLAATAVEGARPNEIVWDVPFTEAGKALAISVSGLPLYVG